MFDSANAKKPIPATVKFTDGRTQLGNIIIAANSDLPRTLNGDGIFIEFELANGQRSFICKSSIVEALPTDIPKARKLDAGSDSDSDFNPFRVLKISPESSFPDIQRAYHDRAKIYHPDRFASTELPDEMAKYAQNMSRLINAAFQILNAQKGEQATPQANSQTGQQPGEHAQTAPSPQAVNL